MQSNGIFKLFASSSRSGHEKPSVIHLFIFQNHFDAPAVEGGENGVKNMGLIKDKVKTSPLSFNFIPCSPCNTPGKKQTTLVPFN